MRNRVKVLAGALLWPCAALAQPVGEVDTVFKLIGPDHKIVVDAHEDPAPSMSCSIQM